MKNIENLEKLSCLKLDDDTKEKVSESLDDVLNLINELKNTEFNYEIVKENIQNFKQKENYELIDKTKKTDGIHLEERGFLSPKVIKK